MILFDSFVGQIILLSLKRQNETQTAADNINNNKKKQKIIIRLLLNVNVEKENYARRQKIVREEICYNIGVCEHRTRGSISNQILMTMANNYENWPFVPLKKSKRVRER